MSTSKFDRKKQSVLANLHNIINHVHAINFGDYELYVDKFKDDDDPEKTALFVLFFISEDDVNL